MSELKINPKFKELLPALSEEEYKQLEESILADGVRESIKVWHNQIVDGHNRFEICEKHDLMFPIMDLHFADEDEALEWIYINQLARRNLSDLQKTIYIGKLYNLRKARHGGDRKSDDFQEIKVQQLHVENGRQETAAQIASDFGVSPRTVKTAGKVAEAIEIVPEEVKSDFLAGKSSQKAVIEKAKEITNPIPKSEEEIDSKKFDDFTNLAKHYGNGLISKLKDLKEFVEKAETSFKLRGSHFPSFASNLAETDFDGLLAEAVGLRNVEKCGYCQAKGCDMCKAGYIIKGDE